MSRTRVRTNAIILIGFVVFCVAVMEWLAINIGQPNPLGSGYTVHAVFSDADGVPTSADVRMSGVVVGKVTDVSHDPKNPGVSVVTMQINDSRANPVYSNGFAKVKPKTLLGEKYVDLTVGSSASGEPIASGGYLPVGQTGKDVSNDEIFNAFDAQTRAQQQQVLQDLDAAVKDRSGDIQSILPQLTDVVANLAPVAQVYEKDQPQTDDIFVQLNTIMQTLADEHQQLAGLLANGNTALGAIADRDAALIGTLREASNVASEINAAAQPTIAAQRQALQQLGPTLVSENSFLGEVVDPQAACGGKPCGIDQVFTGTLLGQVAYPNDQLTVTYPNGTVVTQEWASMFSQKSALNIVLSFHCDSVTTTLQQLLSALTPAEQQQVEQTCKTATGHSIAPASMPAGGAPASDAAWWQVYS